MYRGESSQNQELTRQALMLQKRKIEEGVEGSEYCSFGGERHVNFGKICHL